LFGIVAGIAVTTITTVLTWPSEAPKADPGYFWFSVVAIASLGIAVVTLFYAIGRKREKTAKVDDALEYMGIIEKRLEDIRIASRGPAENGASRESGSQDATG
jgi:hypothetical protein